MKGVSCQDVMGRCPQIAQITQIKTGEIRSGCFILKGTSKNT